MSNDLLCRLIGHSFYSELWKGIVDSITGTEYMYLMEKKCSRCKQNIHVHRITKQSKGET